MVAVVAGDVGCAEFTCTKLMPVPGAYVYPPAIVPLVPLGFVTTTGAKPAGPAGKLAWMVLTFNTATRSAGSPPTVTLAPAAKSLPDMATTVPPLVDPVPGVMLGEVAVAKGVLAVTLKADGADVWPSTLVTVMLAAPFGKDGVRQLIVVVDATPQFTPVAAVPPALLKTTAAPGSKLVPVRVSAIPPASGPE